MAGNITIIEPRDNYQRVSKDIIFNADVDVLALGVYVKVLTVCKKWQMNVNGIAAALKLSPDRIRKVFAVLENAGYLQRKRAQGSHGHFTGWDYFISSVPFTDIAKTPTSENTDDGENRHSDFTDDGKMAMYNNRLDIEITDKNNNRDIEREQPKKGRFVPPTVDEVRAYCAERCNTVDAEAFVAFYASKGWKVGTSTMKDWRAAVITWEKREKSAPALRRPSNYAPDDFNF